jgi:UDP-N-acetylmuramate dehydrogenase
VNKCDIIEKFIAVVGKDNIKINEPMKNHTSFKVGGPADIFITPNDEIQIRDILRLCRENECPIFVMGNGTNLVVKDGGIRGVVLKIFDDFSKIYTEGSMITAEAGALLSVVSKEALRASLKGMEFASGIPGTVGGAIAMNAGAYNSEINDVIYSADVIDDDLNIRTLSKEELQMGYRTSIVSAKGYIAVRAKFALKIGEYDEIKARMDTLRERRKAKQPLNMPSAGSTFKRPKESFAPKLIEEAGLKGRSVGGAMVSTMHSGFIVNVGNATADDILKLIDIVEETVYKKFKISLEPEVKVIGEDL